VTRMWDMEAPNENHHVPRTRSWYITHRVWPLWSPHMCSLGNQPSQSPAYRATDKKLLGTNVLQPFHEPSDLFVLITTTT
jgi:hypothetical protein